MIIIHFREKSHHSYKSWLPSTNHIIFGLMGTGKQIRIIGTVHIS